MTNAEHEMFSRTAALIGQDNLRRLQKCKVVLCGLGGVGGGVLEALVRSGVQCLTLVDADYVSVSNLNRQLIALNGNVGVAKVEAARERALSINPLCEIQMNKALITPENVAQIVVDADWVIDAIDDVPAKVALIKYAKENGIKVISCMGTGNKLHPEFLEIADISKTEMCPLARTLRRKLRDVGINDGVPVVFSKEKPFINGVIDEDGKTVPASIAFVPPVAGMLMAGYIVRQVMED